MLLDIQINVVTVGHTEDFDGVVRSVRIQPHGNGSGTTGFIDCFKFFALAGFLSNRNDISFFFEKRRNVYFIAIEFVVVMDD